MTRITKCSVTMRFIEYHSDPFPQPTVSDLNMVNGNHSEWNSGEGLVCGTVTSWSVPPAFRLQRTRVML